jgi:hypothetical protein
VNKKKKKKTEKKKITSLCSHSKLSSPLTIINGINILKIKATRFKFESEEKSGR